MTVRYPRSTTATEHNVKDLNNKLNNVRESSLSYLLALVNSKPYGDLQTVASDRMLADGDMTAFAFNASPSGNGSLEGIHNNYHVYIGGDGHMGDPRVAAFDPVFWLHHA